MFSLKATPSMLATKKYFFVVIGLILAQVGMGVITAHYAVEGQSFFGIPLAEILPFAMSRTIHTQFAVLWIATAWLATGLYIAPAISGHEPKFQKLGVNVLFYALLFIVVGSTAWRLARHAAESPASNSPSGSATRAWNSPAWAASGKSCCSSACCSGCCCWDAACGRP